MVNCLVFLLPIVADACGGLLIRNGESDIDKADAVVLGNEVGLEFTGRRFVIIAQHRNFISQGKFILAKEGVDVLLDGVADSVLEESKRFLSLRREGEVRAISHGFRRDQPSVRQFVDDLLQGEKVRIFAV